MGTILKGIQSVLIALGIIAVIGTGVVLYYNKIKPESEEAAVASTEATEAQQALETEESTPPDSLEADNSAASAETESSEDRPLSYIEGHEHTYKSTVIKPSTCTEPGEVKYTCYCGDTYVDAIKVKDHTKGQWVTMRAATATQTGLRQKSCTVCGKVLEEDTVPMLAAATTTSTGKNNSKKNTSDHTHSYTYEITDEASCTEKGVKTYTCTICGSTFETSIAATNHPSRRTVREEGTCANPGTIETVCNICDAVISSESIHYEHDWGKWEVTTAATATSKGVKTRTCKDCGKVETRSTNATVVTATGTTNGTTSGSTDGTITGGSTTCSHNFTSRVTVNATCTSAGTTVKTCSLCGATATEAVPAALGHLAGNWTILKKATTTEEGERVKYCSRCGEICETEILAKLPEQHICTYVPTILRQPTCVQDGIRKYTCSGCGDYYTASIPATGNHTYNTSDICTVCGAHR